ncbi:hypothetical protein CSPX01_05940 [Colletotrichum filicis]|nr:hypothetical protein CSPX01_05940 [Colletotrichum filicis]
MPGIQGRRDTEANESEYDDDDDDDEFDNEVPAASRVLSSKRSGVRGTRRFSKDGTKEMWRLSMPKRCPRGGTDRRRKKKKKKKKKKGYAYTTQDAQPSEPQGTALASASASASDISDVG